jgi:hypothetical protein
MKISLFFTTLLVFSLHAGIAYADQIFRCTDTNNSLHFVLYENASGTSGGHMYLNNIQAAVLHTRRINNISVRGTIAGNTAPTEFVFNSSRRKIYIELGGASNVVCNARVTN